MLHAGVEIDREHATTIDTCLCGTGRAVIVENAEEKGHALDAIAARYQARCHVPARPGDIRPGGDSPHRRGESQRAASAARCRRSGAGFRQSVLLAKNICGPDPVFRPAGFTPEAGSSTPQFICGDTGERGASRLQPRFA